MARKRDKKGNRFGFISLLDVKDRGDLLKNLRTIRMGENKLWFNVARFVLEDGEINSHYEERIRYDEANNGYKKQEDKRPEANIGTSKVGDLSFKQMLVGRSLSVDDKMDAFSSLHGRAMVARMVDLAALKNIKIYVNDFSLEGGKVQYIGGLDVLISFEKNEEAMFFKDATSSLSDKFSSVSLWEGQVLGYERLAWLKIKGIPIHLLSNEIIDSVGRMFGRIVHKANRSEEDFDLSYDYVGVLVGDGSRVMEEIIMKWKDRKFRVWVTKEIAEWIPDLLGPEFQSTSGDMDVQEPAKVVSPVPENVVRSDNVDGNGDEREDGDKVNLETINAVNNDNIDEHLMPLIDKENFLGNAEETFIPGVDFPFENDCEIDGNFSVNNINKRKKFKKVDLDRPSYGYTSSQESLKIIKKPKNIEKDTFGLDSMLGLDKSGLDKVFDESIVNGNVNSEGVIDLNSQPDECAQSTSYVDEERTACDDNLEISKTITLGDKLGVNLKNCEKMIKESLIKEGLQSGIP